MTDNPRALAARLLARSRFAMPLADALAHIETRRRTLLADAPTEPEPDFTAAEPLPLIDAPTSFAKEFWDKRNKPTPRSKGKPNLRLVDGDKQD